LPASADPSSTTNGTTPLPDRPLCVDLDGTLIASDTLVESAIRTAAQGPVHVFGLLQSLRQSRAALKSYAADHGTPDVTVLPYREDVLAALRHAKSEGRHLILVTAADHRIAGAVADHLDLFDEVIATRDGVNLKGDAKAAALVERFGEGGFDYVGDTHADLPVWAKAKDAWVVEDGIAANAVCTALRKDPARRFPVAKPELRAWVSGARLYQWVKNVLVFVPVVAAGAMWSLDTILLGIIAFVCFGLFASGTYMLNDLSDLDADRHHPRKRRRAFASGRIAPVKGLVVGPGLMLVALLIAVITEPLFAAVLVAYGALTICYTVYLKTRPLVDVYALAALYCVRIVGGAAATGIVPSIWLLSFSSFLFLALALLKRFNELSQVGAKSGRRGYAEGEHILLMAFGVASTFSSAIVFALYAESQAADLLYSRRELLWGIVPLLLFWQSRLWLSAWRGYVDDDPIIYAAKDWVSWIAISLCGLLFLAS
jgi:4-hydroxybenzoate polyprenyltransferase/phosphoserine phosphatase